MQANSYTPELMAIFRNYASSLRPTPMPEYTVLHEEHSWIQVPAGHLPIRIAQFSVDGGDNHWAIFVPTSIQRGVGNFYEIAGNQKGNPFFRRIIHTRHANWDSYEKGSHLVGFVAPTFLQRLDTHLSSIAVKPEKSRSWVTEALKGLDDPHMFAVQMKDDQWIQQMRIVEQAWELGDA